MFSRSGPLFRLPVEHSPASSHLMVPPNSSAPTELPPSISERPTDHDDYDLVCNDQTSLPISPVIAAVAAMTMQNDQARLDQLPDELVSRIISSTGSPYEQMRAAFALGGVCRRLRTVLQSHFIPSLVEISKDGLSALALHDPARATVALRAMLLKTRSVRRLALDGYSPQVFTSACFMALASSSGVSLRIVNLAYSYVGDQCIAPLLEQCPNLTELTLHSCANITGHAFDSQVTAPITRLDLSYMHRLSAAALRALAVIPTILSLKLAGCVVINSSGLNVLSSGILANSLEDINLKCCPVDDESILNLVERCPKLRTITLAQHHDNLWETGNYTPTLLQLMQERFPHVVVVIEN